MSLTISLNIQYNNNLKRTLTGVHSSKGMEYTTEKELITWSKQMVTQLKELDPLKPHKSLELIYNHSYCDSTKATMTKQVDIRDIETAIDETKWVFKLVSKWAV